jgi:hypothetical protein
MYQFQPVKDLFVSVNLRVVLDYSQSTLLSRLLAKSWICRSGNGAKLFCLRKSNTLIPYSSETIQG